MAIKKDFSTTVSINKKNDNENENYNNNLMENITEQILLEKDIKLDYSSNLSEEESTQVLRRIADNRKFTEKEAAMSLAALAQIGGTSPRAQGTVHVTINGTKFTLDLAWKSIREITGKSFRRYAKNHAETFQKICKHLNIQGNLVSKIELKLNWTISENEKFYASDYQSDNSNCPENIKALLKEYYNQFVASANQTKKKN